MERSRASVIQLLHVLTVRRAPGATSRIANAAALVKDERFTFDRWELAQPPANPAFTRDGIRTPAPPG